MATCDDMDRLLTPWVDGEATAPERLEVDGHLARCPRCAARAGAERLARTVLQSRRAALTAERAPEHLRARVAAISARRAPPITWMRWSAAAAAALVLIVFGLQLTTGRSTTVLAAQLALDHKKCHWMDGDRHLVDPRAAHDRLAARYGFDAVVPAGWGDKRLRLVGVRRCLTGEGANAHILYRYEGRRVSLYLLPNDTRQPGTAALLGTRTWTWPGHNGSYVLVADDSLADPAGLVTYMRHATEDETAGGHQDR